LSKFHQEPLSETDADLADRERGADGHALTEDWVSPCGAVIISLEARRGKPAAVFSEIEKDDASAYFVLAKPNGGQAPAHVARFDGDTRPTVAAEQSVQIEQRADKPSPQFDHETARTFYNAVRPDGVVLGYTDGCPIRNADEFVQIANEADSRREHFFFAVAKLKPEWSDPRTHERAKVTTPSKSHIHEHLYLGFDCDAEKYTGNDPVAAAQHYEHEGRRIKTSLDKQLSELGIQPFALWRSGAGWQGLIKLDQPIAHRKNTRTWSASCTSRIT
jgi:hypothetical protein